MKASPRAKLETGHGRDNIGDWYDASETVTWGIGFINGAKFEVRVTYSCIPDKGGDFEVRVGDQKFSGHARDTGGWNQFQEVALGYLEMQPGMYTLEVVPTAHDWKAMNLAEVRLALM